MARDLSIHERLHARSVLFTADFLLGEWRELGQMADETVAEISEEAAVGCGAIQQVAALLGLFWEATGDLDRART